MELTLIDFVDSTLRRSLDNIAHGKLELGKSRLRRLHSQVKSVVSTRLSGLLDLSVSRFTALDLCLDGSFDRGIKRLNDAIYMCPLHSLGPVRGLSESLVLLADAYTATGRYEEAMHSACLAMDFSAERVAQVWNLRV